MEGEVSENIRYRWDEFRDWCEDEDISLRRPTAWQPWWACWKAAIDADKGYEGLQ